MQNKFKNFIEYLLNLTPNEITLAVLFILPLVILSPDPFINLDIKSYFICILGAILLVLEIIDFSANRVTYKPTLFNYLTIVFILLLGISTLFSINPANSLFGGWSYRIGSITIVAFLICGYFVKDVKSSFLSTLSFITATFLAIISIIMDFNILSMGSRLTGPIHQANVLAVILGIGLILGFSFYKTKSKYITLFTIVGQTILLLGIILTQSRLILGLTIISALIVSIKVINKDFFSNLTLYFKHKFTPIIVIAFIAITGISSYTLSINASFNRIFSFGLLETGVEYRIHLQEQGLKLLTVTPIYGWGTDSIIFVYNKYFELPKDIQSSYSEEGQNVDSTHNVFLDKFLELGIIGGSIYILLIATTLYHGAKNATTIEDKLILVTLVFFTVQSLLNVTMVEQEIINWILIFKVNTFEKHRP